MELLPEFLQKFWHPFWLPYASYLELAAMCIADANSADGYFRCWQPGKTTANGTPCPPIELLVLTALRYLGRGWTFDDLEESTAISEEVTRTFANTFLQFGLMYCFLNGCTLPKV